MTSSAVRIAVFGCALFPAPLHSQPPAARAQELLRQNKPGEALPILLDLHAAAPADANVCQQIGVAYTQLEDLPHAETFYREAVRLNPQFWAARKNLGTVLWFLERKDESEREFLAVATALPADPVPHLYLGLASHARREFPRAKLQFEKAGALASDNPEVLPAVLESYLATHDVNFPQKMTDQLARSESADADALSRVGQLFLRYGYPDRAAAALEKVVTAHSDSPDNWRMLAQAYDRQGKPERAYEAYSRAVDANPSEEESYIAFAEFASAHANNDYALQVAARGLERLPKSYALRFEQGLLQALKGDRSLAASSFQQASSLKPDWPLPLLALGVTHLEAGEIAQAAALFQKARELDPRDGSAHYLYALALSRESGGIAGAAKSEAVAALRKAIELNPKDGRSHTLLGQFQLTAGDVEGAAREWRAALRIEPENPTALYQLGLLYGKQGKTEEARRLLELFQRVKAKKRTDEESLVEILRVVPGQRAP